MLTDIFEHRETKMSRRGKRGCSLPVGRSGFFQKQSGMSAGSQHGLGKYKLRDIRTVTMIEQVFGRLDVKLL